MTAQPEVVWMIEVGSRIQASRIRAHVYEIAVMDYEPSPPVVPMVPQASLTAALAERDEARATLGHIEREANAARVPTNRLRAIAAHAASTLRGEPFPADFKVPKHVDTEYVRLNRRHIELKAERDKLAKALGEAEKLLCDAEWGKDIDGEPWCHHCKRYEWQMHAKDCPLAAFLTAQAAQGEKL